MPVSIKSLNLNDGKTAQHRLASMSADIFCHFHALTYAIHDKIDL